MTTVQIALLRGINVGRAKRVGMPELCRTFVRLGLVDVRSLMVSGNVTFRSPRPLGRNFSATLERAIAEKHGIECRVVLLAAHELDAIVAGNPLLDVADDPARLLVHVLRTAADRAKLKPLLEQDWGRERLAAGKRWAYAWCAKGVLDGPLVKAVSRALKDSATGRNWSTMLKLQRIANGEDA